MRTVRSTDDRDDDDSAETMTTVPPDDSKPTGASQPTHTVADLGSGRGPGWLDAALAAHLPAVIELRRTLHTQPELSLHETNTTALIQSVLAAAGIASTVLPGGTGLVADIGDGDGPAIGLRADIDALPLQEATNLPFASAVPGVTHACGHDVHTAVLIGAALALKAAPTLPGRVRLMFQPAEEVMAGARQLVDAGAAEGLDRVYAVHCDPSVRVGQVALKSGPITSATDIVSIDISGPGGHTSRPHLTVDVVGALASLATQLPTLLARLFDPRAGVTLVWGAIDAGETFNVIPQRGTLQGTLRILDRAAWEAAGPLLAELVGQILAPTRAHYQLHHSPGVPPVVNDDDAVAAFRMGVANGLGSDAIAAAEQSTGAEDFAVLLDDVPGALARLGVWDDADEQVDLHSPTFRADERAIAVGVRTLVHTVLASDQVLE